jgi:hypothetical protein
VTTAASFTVLQAVDGITLRYAVDDWASAPAPQKAAAFSAAEVARWTEIGMNSLSYFLAGLTLFLFGLAIALGRVYPRWVGLMATVSQEPRSCTTVRWLWPTKASYHRLSNWLACLCWLCGRSLWQRSCGATVVADASLVLNRLPQDRLSAPPAHADRGNGPRPRNRDNQARRPRVGRTAACTTWQEARTPPRHRCTRSVKGVENDETLFLLDGRR